MITAIVFSRDRPPQLDLLLRSVQKNLGGIRPITVLYKATSQPYQDGYTLCEAIHPEAIFVREHDFRAETLALLRTARTEYATFLCDDDIAFRAAPLMIATDALAGSPDMLCFSLRLGRNTVRCYSLDIDQGDNPEAQALGRPESRMLFWDWTNGAVGDWSYPGSLDGHLWRRPQLLRLIMSRTHWRGPNELEDALNQACQSSLLPLMASFVSSRVVGCPANVVNTTHRTNRHGERFHHDPGTLNAQFLQGARLALDAIDPHAVNAAHVEFALRWAA